MNGIVTVCVFLGAGFCFAWNQLKITRHDSIIKLSQLSNTKIVIVIDHLHLPKHLTYTTSQNCSLLPDLLTL